MANTNNKNFVIIPFKDPIMPKDQTNDPKTKVAVANVKILFKSLP